MIYYKNGAKMMRPILTREEYMTLRDSNEQQQTVKAVRSGDEARKQRLLQMNYSCLPNDDGTLKGSTRMSNTVGMDVDHIAPEQLQAVRERIISQREQLGLMMLELSARGQGYHLVFRRHGEMTNEENLEWASRLLQVDFDKGAKDITRVFFTTTTADLLFLDEEIFGLSPDPSPSTHKGRFSLCTDVGADDESTQKEPSPLCTFPQEFKGVAYSSIISEYWRRTGGEPSEGERNKRQHQLAANLRAICDNNEEWLLEVMPSYKLSVQEMKSIIHSACKEPTKGSRLIDKSSMRSKWVSLRMKSRMPRLLRPRLA